MKSFRKALALTSVCLAAAGALATLTTSCKDDGDGDASKTVLTDAQKADVTKASAATVGRLAASSSSSGLRDPATIAKIKNLYANAKRAQSFAMTEDEAPTFDICGYMEKACPDQIGKEDELDDDGTSCKTTSCTGGTNMSCTSPAQSTVCAGVTYTLGEATSNSVMTCTKGTGNAVTLGIKADFAGALSGGTLTTPVQLECNVVLSMALDFSATGEQSSTGDDEVELSCEDGQFTCTIDGTPLSCEEIKAAIDEKSCG